MMFLSELQEKNEKCYSRRTANVDFYEALSIVGLRLPLTKLYRQLDDYLDVYVYQIAPNAWWIFLGAEVLWYQMNGGCCRLTLNKFFYYYKPQQIVVSKGFFNFVCRKPSLRLVSNMLDSNCDWKGRYFFIQGSNWGCRPDEWDSMPDGVDNTWGVLDKSGESSVPMLCLVCRPLLLSNPDSCLTLFFVSLGEPDD